MRRRRNPEIVSGRVNGDGTIAAGSDFTVTKGSTGAYVVRPTPPMRAILAVHVTIISITGNLVVATPSGEQINVQLWNNSAVAADMAFSITIVGNS